LTVLVCIQKYQQQVLVLEDRSVTVVFCEAGGVTVSWGLWICAAVVGGSAAILEQGTEISGKQLVMLR